MAKLFKRFLKWVKAGSGALTVGGLTDFCLKQLARSWHWVGNLDLMSDIWQLSGLKVPFIISVASSPFFGLGLMVIGFLGLPAVIKADDKPLPKIWYVLGWGVFCLSSSLIAATLLFSNFARSSGVTQAQNFYERQHSPRKLQSKDISNLTEKACPVVSTVAPITIVSVDSPEALSYAQQFINTFKDCRVAMSYSGRDETFPFITATADTNRKGLVIPVKDLVHPDEKSMLLLSALRGIGLNVRMLQYEDSAAEALPLNPTLFISFPD